MGEILEKGRPRAFDPEQALDRALEVFWREGFQGASLSALTAAMGLNKPSLYAAFGDKEALYLKALKRYAERENACAFGAMQVDPDARRAIEALLHAMVRLLTDPSRPGGCFVVTGSADCGMGGTPEAVQQALRQALRAGETAIKERLKRARQDAQLPPEADVPALAAYFAAVVSGLSVQARSGVPRARLDSAVRVAMNAWPQPGRKRPGATAPLSTARSPARSPSSRT
jgi:AcrR family transcriptional regulator